MGYEDNVLFYFSSCGVKFQSEPLPISCGEGIYVLSSCGHLKIQNW